MRRFFRRHVSRFLCVAAMIAPSAGMRVFFNRLKGCKIGKNVWIGPQVFLDVHLDHPDPKNAVCIGDHVSVGQNVLAFTHDSSYWQVTRGQQPIEFGRVVIGSDTYIGPNALLYNTTVGHHCIIMAHSVLVGREFPSHSLIAGYPARVIKDLRKEIEGDRDTV